MFTYSAITIRITDGVVYHELEVYPVCVDELAKVALCGSGGKAL